MNLRSVSSKQETPREGRPNCFSPFYLCGWLSVSPPESHSYSLRGADFREKIIKSLRKNRYYGQN